MKCFLDMDGVLVDFCGGFEKRYNVTPEMLARLVKPYPWDWIFELGVVTKNEFWDNLGSDFWANLEWTAEGKEVLETCIRTFGFDNVCILTDPGLQAATIIGKHEWLNKHMPRFKQQVLLGRPKHFCASEFSILVDDADHNIEKFEDHGGWGLLFPRPWNKLYNTNSIEYFRTKLTNLSAISIFEGVH